ncbi:MAG TPA: YCF48-related protein [Blastocatellia bacterium]|jgi:photosystem II stability/assembly factor-like uncharacterized protein|nr:YCF48-related protein [Blastocatellia bacterium]
MIKIRIAIAFVLTASLFASACSKREAPGEWSIVDTGTGDAFYSVNFVDENTGWLNGNTDRTFETLEPDANTNANGNRSGRPAPTPAKTPDPLKANQGFEVLQTTDGGRTWRQIPDQFKNKIRSVWFVDPRQGWALTIDRDILNTTDGGSTWALQRKAGKVQLKLPHNRRDPVLEQPEQIDSIRFIDPLHGWAWGGGRKDNYSEQPGIFLVTSDGGKNWSEVTYPFDQNVWGIFFLDALNAWASTEGTFYRTRDGGLNWAKVETKLPEQVFRSVFFVDENNGWVATRDGRLAKTSNGGRTWTNIYKIKLEYKMRDVFFWDKDRGWAVGDNGAILYTPDGGNTWVGSSTPVGGQLIDVAFVSEKTGWAVGLGGAAFRYDASPGSE